jgi:hypothetical protein
MAMGDADGDGSPDFCATDGWQTVSLLDVDGNVLHDWDVSGGIENGAAGGGCSMADLDADGDFEVLVQTQAGLFIFDGATGDTLLFDAHYPTSVRDGAPIIADLDGDGSAEIALVVYQALPETEKLVVLGAAKGRWARTRLVWNQLPYDVTSIADDGTIIASPLPPSQTYGGVFRAQPAHDGALPDLSVDLQIGSSKDPVELDFTVHNLGSVDAPAGTTLVLRSWDGASWSELSTTTLKDALPAESAVSGSMVVDAADLGSRVVLEAQGASTDCDVINDRSKEIRR